MAPGDNPYQGNLLAQMVIVLVLACLTIGAHRSKRVPGTQGTGAFLKESVRFVWGNRKLLLLFAGIALWGFSFNAIELYWQPQLKDILGTAGKDWVFGGLNATYFLMATGGGLLVARLLSLRRIAPFPLIGGLKLLIGVFFVALASQGHFVGFALCFLLVMGLNGMAGVPESTALNGEIPPERRASLLSVASLASQLGGIMASLLFSLLLFWRWSIPAIWILAGVAMAGSAGLYFYLHKHTRAFPQA